MSLTAFLLWNKNQLYTFIICYLTVFLYLIILYKVLVINKIKSLKISQKPL